MNDTECSDEDTNYKQMFYREDNSLPNQNFHPERENHNFIHFNEPLTTRDGFALTIRGDSACATTLNPGFLTENHNDIQNPDHMSDGLEVNDSTISLDSFITENFPDKIVPEHQAQKIVEQLFVILKNLHKAGKSYVILEFENILMIEHKNYIISGYQGISTKDMTLITTAPEMLKSRISQEKSNIWPLGIIIYKMLSGNYPFEVTNTTVSDEVLGQTILSSIENLPSMSIIKSLLQLMLKIDHNERISFQELSEHSWITGNGLNLTINDNSTGEIIQAVDRKTWYPDTSPEFKIMYYQKYAFEKSNIYNIEKKLLESSSSSIYKGQDQSTGLDVAIKVFPAGNSKNNGFSEFDMLSKIQHKNVIKALGFCKFQNKNYLVLEYCKNGNLDSFIKNNFDENRIPELEAYYLIGKILSGVEAITKKGILHSGLSLENILLDDDYTPKISGFMRATLIDSNEIHDGRKHRSLSNIPNLEDKYNYHHQRSKSLNHIADLESLEERYNYNYKCNIWSLGVLAYEMITGNSIISNLNLLSEEGRIFQEIEEKLAEHIGEESVKVLMGRILTPQLDRRISLKGLKKQYEAIQSNLENKRFTWDDSNLVNNIARISWVDYQNMDLENSGIGDEELELIGITSLVSLQNLNVSFNKISKNGVEKLAKNNSWTNFESLNITRNDIGAEGAINLAKNTSWINVKSLNLDSTNIGDSGVESLARNKFWTNLLYLNLDVNNIGATGAKYLANNTSWSNLQHLSLEKNNIGTDGAEYLAGNTSWALLETLNLDHNKIRANGVRNLAKNTSWICLQNLSIANNNIGKTDLEKLIAGNCWSSQIDINFGVDMSNSSFVSKQSSNMSFCNH